MKTKKQFTPTEALVMMHMRSTPKPQTYESLIEATGASIYTLPSLMRKLRNAGLVDRTIDGCVAYFTLTQAVQQ